MKFIIILFKWLFTKETLSNILFGIKITKSLFGNNKNKAIIEKLNIAQNMVDNLNKIIPNEKKDATTSCQSSYSNTESLVDKINHNQKEWGGFTAIVEKNRHGEGKNGVLLGYTGNIAGIGLDFSYDPTNGNANGEIKLGF